MSRIGDEYQPFTCYVLTNTPPGLRGGVVQLVAVSVFTRRFVRFVRGGLCEASAAGPLAVFARSFLFGIGPPRLLVLVLSRIRTLKLPLNQKQLQFLSI